jgi:hypothetical protein
MWANDVDGDCVAAEEAFKDACTPGVFITDAEVVAWATANNALNGADLITVLDIMQTAGFSQGGKLYNDGHPNSVDWTNTTALQNAIATGPVKIGVAADQLQNAVPEPPSNGWIATGFQPDNNLDHCTSLPGFGTLGWLCSQLGVSVPSGMDGSAPNYYALYTWDSIGIIDFASLQAITGEAWLRTPNTILSLPTKPPYAWWWGKMTIEQEILALAEEILKVSKQSKRDSESALRTANETFKVVSQIEQQVAQLLAENELNDGITLSIPSQTLK